MEVIRNVPADRPHVQRYRGGGFTISGIRYDGPVLVLPTKALTWPAASIGTIDTPSLISALSEGGADLCLFGCGERMEPLPGTLRQALKDAGIGADAMATGAAARTFNMLIGEGRAVGAVLLPL